MQTNQIISHVHGFYFAAMMNWISVTKSTILVSLYVKDTEPKPC